MDSSIRVNDIPTVAEGETTADDQMIDLTFLRGTLKVHLSKI